MGKIKLNKRTKEALYAGLPYLFIAIVIALGGMLIIETIFPQPTIPFKITWEGIAMFMAICAGLGWVCHGTGFLLVKG